MGSPIIHLHSALHISPWGEFLYAVATGQDYDLKWKKGFGIVTLLAAPPFPYASEDIAKGVLLGAAIYFDKMTKSEMKNIHLEEVSYDMKSQNYYISDTRGYIMYATAVESSIPKTQETINKLIKKIQFPKMIYRPDIGSRFQEIEYKKLIEWGYL
jgi:phosphoribosylamine-glycine ligase